MISGLVSRLTSRGVEQGLHAGGHSIAKIMVNLVSSPWMSTQASLQFRHPNQALVWLVSHTRPSQASGPH